MDENAFKERTKRLTEVNKVISQLDESIRASAFELLRDYVTGAHPKPAKRKDDQESEEGDLASLIAKHDTKKASDAALLVAAHLFSEYGSAPFSLEEVKSVADDAGLTISGRLDMTFKQFKRDGKSLFKKSGKGSFKPTVAGESHLKETFGVTKGKKTKNVQSDE